MSRGRDTRAPVANWLAYVTSLPTDDAPARMRVLRTLDSLGCAVLREGVYLLPESDANRQGLNRLTDYISRLNGEATLLVVTAADETQVGHFRSLFNRSEKYEEFSKSVESLRAGFGVSDPASIARILLKQRRNFEAISALDFFPSAARDRAANTLKNAEDSVRELLFPEAGMPNPSAQSESRYFKRVWATRNPLWADRLASAWLVRRFIDPGATLLWLDKSQECPSTAVGFCFEGAVFANSRSGVTFEQLLESFGLWSNTALTRIGALVHCLETGGTPVAEAAGVETLLLGAQRRSCGSDELFAESEKTFDLLYDAYNDGPETT